MQHIILGFAYSITASGGTYFITIEGIAGKKRTGRPGGVTPIPFPPDQYIIMHECATIPATMKAIREDILNGLFDMNEHVVRCVTGLRVDLINNFGFTFQDNK